MSAIIERLATLLRTLTLIGIFCGAASVLSAQTPPPRPGSVRVTVRDATDLPISAAHVIVTGVGLSRDALTNDRGIADLDGLPPGPYDITVESPGFQPGTVTGLQVRSGARTSRALVLQIAGILEEVDVLPGDADQQLANAFTTDLRPEDLAALPEDPEELAEVLAQLAGLDADIRVDGFVGGTLPPGTQIQSVRIRYDAASAGSSGGGPRVEIRTVPGGDRWRSNASLRVRDEALNARNAFAATRPTGQTRQYSWSINGPVVKNKTGLSFSVDRSESIDQIATRAATPTGLLQDLVRIPSNRLNVSTRIEHALTPAQRLRVDLRQSGDDALNQGLGEFDVRERAYSRNGSDGELRIGHNATIGRRMVHDIRFTTSWRSTESQPRSLATAIRIPSSYSAGGAQIQGGRDSLESEFEDELMLTVKTQHQLTIGINVSHGHYQGDEWRNAGGTFTFASPDDLAAGRATSFTQRVGDPRFEYSSYRYGAFVQDDVRVRKNLVLNLGVRHESQSQLSDWANFAPRLGVNWTPSARARTSLRAGFNVSFQPFQGSTYEQTLLVNGERQREVIIASPSYPDPFLDGVLAAARPPGIIRADPNLIMPSTRRVSFGVDQPLAKLGRVRASYSRQIGRHLFRSVDVNAPVNGVRPDPAARTITELQSSARSLNQSLELNLQLNYPKRRLSGNATYSFGQQRNETDGALTLPPDSFNLDAEWGPSRQDIRHRFESSLNSDLAYGFRLSANVRAQSAAPYTITTGLDLNGDGVNNERPDGFARNSARGKGTRNFDMTLTWGFGVGERPLPAPPRGRVAAAAGNTQNRPAPLVRFELFAQASNALNLVNPQSFSGVMTSPFFGRPTSAAPARRISVGSRVYF